MEGIEMTYWDKRPSAYIIRHGETELNSSNCWRGWENPSLNEEGHAAGRAIQNFFQWERVGAVVCSDLLRAVQTATYILDTGNVLCPYISPDPNLRSWAIGDFAGQQKTPASLRAFRRYLDDPSRVIPGTDTLPGESLNQFRTRNEEAILPYILQPHQGLPTAIVVHTSNITALSRLISELDQNDEESVDVVAPGGIIAVYVDIEGKMTMEVVMGEVNAEATPEVS